MKKSTLNKIMKRIKKKFNKTKNQKGGRQLDSSGSIGNMIGQIIGMIENGVQGMITGVEATWDMISLPGDLAWDLNRPNEPLPTNTPVYKDIKNI
jgi:hypothetical protein